MSTEEVTTTEDQPAADNAPDFSEQIADLGSKFDKFVESQQAPEPVAPDALLNFDDIDLDDYDEPDYEGETDEDPVDPRVQALESYVIAKEERETNKRLESLAKKYPDLTDPQMVAQIKGQVSEITTDPASVRDYPRLVENIYLAIKAQAEADAETPAEEARSRGARLETDASAGAPTEEDPDAEFKKAFREVTTGSKDIFDS